MLAVFALCCFIIYVLRTEGLKRSLELHTHSDEAVCQTAGYESDHVRSSLYLHSCTFSCILAFPVCLCPDVSYLSDLPADSDHMRRPRHPSQWIKSRR